MLSKSGSKLLKAFELQGAMRRHFSVSVRDLYIQNVRLQKKINIMQLYTTNRKMKYDKPYMNYDRETGEVTIIEGSEHKKQFEKKKVVRDFQELDQEKKRLLHELNLDEFGNPKEENVDRDDLAERLKKLNEFKHQDFEEDPSKVFVFSKDMMRVDIGLIIQRPPIFMRMRDPDFKFMRERHDLMAEYHSDMKQFIPEFNEISKLNEDNISKNAYASRMNVDNYPTHEWTDEATGEQQFYCGASKQWSKVDPKCSNRRSLHYAGEDRVYLMLRNKHTGEWEFPVSTIHFGTTFFKQKVNLFSDLTDNKWRIKFFGSSPIMHTLREMTALEKRDIKNESLKGCRTYWFGAHHWRGFPEMAFKDHHDFDDFAWVPKRQANEYLTRENYEVFAPVMRTR
mmetsp:Transcript_13477/g.22935  ORF Transcript_13477/g.22935 Transcript_13477/m.22935 type:complete len:396 (-) Transcript_13477:96-1283(-)|eukprot:CAMPEP_0168619946 /NCGR_PEP_ID=MMETSP0449_2-20121227/6872_1 /TAXON_ID=1082188 /ORGANISM="Strombidium rassoulzadegani, Strain ras09" /LENGTH=395 /DNA_ID=CAMNT_0008660913 /DNA_START=18 /DNA_END=1205 /DNA_ORIENTATION=+